MVTEVKRQSCDRCKFWKLGDPLKEIANYGSCTWALRPRAKDRNPYDNRPFWLAEIARRTLSWEGEQCATFVRKRGAKP